MRLISPPQTHTSYSQSPSCLKMISRVTCSITSWTKGGSPLLKLLLTCLMSTESDHKSLWTLSLVLESWNTESIKKERKKERSMALRTSGFSTPFFTKAPCPLQQWGHIFSGLCFPKIFTRTSALLVFTCVAIFKPRQILAFLNPSCHSHTEVLGSPGPPAPPSTSCTPPFYVYVNLGTPAQPGSLLPSLVLLFGREHCWAWSPVALLDSSSLQVCLPGLTVIFPSRSLEGLHSPLQKHKAVILQFALLLSLRILTSHGHCSQEWHQNSYSQLVPSGLWVPGPAQHLFSWLLSHLHQEVAFYNFIWIVLNIRPMGNKK